MAKIKRGRDRAADIDLFEDAVDAKRTHDELVFARDKLGEFLDLIPAGLFIHQQQSILFANSEAARLVGMPAEELVGHHWLDFLAEDGRDDIREKFNKCFSSRVTFRLIETKMIGTDGREKTIHLSMSPLFWEGLPVINIVISDITDLKRKEHELFILSTTDSLTGAANHRYFMEQAKRESYRCQRYGHTLAVLTFDIDHFKVINDTYGHAIGDEALKATVETALVALRKEDVLGRLGGEEFAVLLPETTLAGARHAAERLRTQLQTIAISTPQGEVRLTASFGLSQYYPGEASIDPTLRRADDALYEAKRAGRNRVREKL